MVGERRFLGLFSSAAYTESVRRVPVVRRKVAGGPRGRRASRPTATTAATCSRSWRPTRATSCSRPRADELRSIVTSVLYLQERRRLRLYLRQDEYGRYYSALVYLPRDRYTTGVRLRLHRHPQGGARRHQRRLHRLEHRVDPVPAALRGARPGRHRADRAHRRRLRRASRPAWSRPPAPGPTASPTR